MRRLALLLALATTAHAASPLTYRVYPPRAQTADRPVTLSILLTNPGARAVSFNTALCPQVTLTDVYAKKTYQTPQACPEPIIGLPVPAGGSAVYTLRTGLTLPSGQYEASIRLNDTANGHTAHLQTTLSVLPNPQVIERLEVAPVLVNPEVVEVTVLTLNVSRAVFRQDLRLCPTTFVLLDARGKSAYEPPAIQTCTTDLRPTTLRPGEAHTERWTMRVRLAPGTYTLLHWGGAGASVTTFEVVR